MKIMRASDLPALRRSGVLDNMLTGKECFYLETSHWYVNKVIPLLFISFVVLVVAASLIPVSQVGIWEASLMVAFFLFSSVAAVFLGDQTLKTIAAKLNTLSECGVQSNSNFDLMKTQAELYLVSIFTSFWHERANYSCVDHSAENLLRRAEDLYKLFDERGLVGRSISHYSEEGMAALPKIIAQKANVMPDTASAAIRE